MNSVLLRIYIWLERLIEDEQGQDLVEYSLVIALVAFGGTTGMRFLATGINHAFSGIATTLTANV